MLTEALPRQNLLRQTFNQQAQANTPQEGPKFNPAAAVQEQKDMQERITNIESENEKLKSQVEGRDVHIAEHHQQEGISDNQVTIGDEFSLFQPHLRNLSKPKNALDRAMLKMLRWRQGHGIQTLWGRSHEHQKPGFIRRLFKPWLVAFGADAGTNFLPAVATVGDIARNTGTLVKSSIGPAIGVGVVGATIRGATDLGWATLGKESAIDKFIRELRFRQDSSHPKGIIEFDHIFNSRALSDLNQIDEIKLDRDRIGETKHLRTHPQERERLMLKASHLKLNKMLFEERTSSEVRGLLNEHEREVFARVDKGYDFASELFDSLDIGEKVNFNGKLVSYINRRELINHGTLLLKRMAVTGLQTSAVGAAVSMLKSLSTSGVFAEWGRKISTTVKDGYNYVATGLSTLAHNVSATVGGWLDKLKLPSIDSLFPSSTTAAPTSIPTPSSSGDGILYIRPTNDFKLTFVSNP